jgi:hypothetical protein
MNVTTTRSKKDCETSFTVNFTHSS